MKQLFTIKKINQMAESKTDKSRNSKVDSFKQRAKEEAKKAKIQKTHLMPLTEWEATEVLDLRGDLLEAMEQQFIAVWQNLAHAKHLVDQAQGEFQKAAHVMQMIIKKNVDAGKIKMKYMWNNGDDATEADIAKFEADLERLREEQAQKRDEELNEQEKVIQLQNAAKTGLVGTNGEPIGSTRNLDEDSADEELTTDAYAEQSYGASQQPADETE